MMPRGRITHFLNIMSNYNLQNNVTISHSIVGRLDYEEQLSSNSNPGVTRMPISTALCSATQKMAELNHLWSMIPDGDHLLMVVSAGKISTRYVVPDVNNAYLHSLHLTEDVDRSFISPTDWIHDVGKLGAGAKAGDGPPKKSWVRKREVDLVNDQQSPPLVGPSPANKHKRTLNSPRDDNGKRIARSKIPKAQRSKGQGSRGHREMTLISKSLADQSSRLAGERDAYRSLSASESSNASDSSSSVIDVASLPLTDDERKSGPYAPLVSSETTPISSRYKPVSSTPPSDPFTFIPSEPIPPKPSDITHASILGIVPNLNFYLHETQPNGLIIPVMLFCFFFNYIILHYLHIHFLMEYFFLEYLQYLLTFDS